MEAMDLGHGVGTDMLQFSPDSRQLATCHGDRTVRLRNARTGGNEQILQGHKGNVWALSYSPDGRRLASAGGNAIVWSPKQGRRLGVTSMGADEATFVAFSPDGKRLVQTFEAENEEKQVYIRDARKGNIRQVLSLSKDDSSHIAFTPDSRKIYGLNTSTGQIYTWTVR
jgi:WD40 repeat protein